MMLSLVPAAVAAPSETTLIVRVLVGLGLSYALGFERELRGAGAGNRTFALLGGSAACISSVAFTSAPQLLAGVLTGIGFIGAGLVIHEGPAAVKGITTAAALFFATIVGLVAGTGHPALATVTTAAGLLMLELRHIPVLRWFDGSYWEHRVPDDFSVELAPLPQRHARSVGALLDAHRLHGRHEDHDQSAAEQSAPGKGEAGLGVRCPDLGVVTKLQTRGSET